MLSMVYCVDRFSGGRVAFPDRTYGYVILITLFGLVVSWGVNLIEVFETFADPVTGLFVLRAVGIFIFPLGALLGFF